ncbi:MAG TPA: hypothetical protein VHI75_07475 [Casimicrobiaceae bacterium]|nr:hypothetical protein [Casimicrobiaceae bacterium]
MTNREPPSDLANRMAGWFFIVFGVAVLLFAAAVLSTWTPDAPPFVWVLAFLGIVTVLFGVFANRNLRASVLQAMIAFLWVF